jgi:UDP-N-acetylmuramoyl-tripeptide--D-alanyl-D-alanine ligase
VTAVSEPLWTWPALCAALRLPVVAGPDVGGVAIDSRALAPGDLFVALKGDPGPRFETAQRSERDGHDYIDDALRRGAVGVLVDRPVGASVPALVVPDTLEGLWQLGATARARLAGRVFAVTGSSGKTTAKTFLAAALGCHASAASFNNHLGVPLSLARTPASARAAVFEIGTNHPGEIEPLTRLVRPHVAVVLNVGQAHLEFFPDWDALRREKLSIAAGLESGGTLVVPDDLALDGLERNSAVVRFGTSATATVRLVGEVPARHEATFRIDGRDSCARVPGGGHHRALTLAAVIAAIRGAGLPDAGAFGLEESLVPAGRGRRHTIGGLTLIDDSYNANPASLAGALATLSFEPSPRYAILGEMLELGSGSAAAHAALATHCAALDGVVCVGTGMRALFEALLPAQRLCYVERVEDLPDAVLERVLKDARTVLVKGSNRVFWAKGFVDRLLERLGAEA